MPKIPKKIAKQLKTNNKTITQYFGTPKNGNISEIIPNEESDGIENGNTNNTATEFYKACLEAKSDACEPEKNCHTIKKMLENRLALAEEKLEKINKADTICSEMIDKKDNTIELLNAQIQSQVREDLDTQTSPSPSKASSSPKVSSLPKKIIFENSKALTEDQLCKLRSIDKTQSADSSFILNSVRFFYSDNLAKLNGKSVRGISRGKPTQAMSPDKLDLMKSLYNERISDMNLPVEERVNREKKFNRHVHRAITNINARKNNENVKLPINMNN